MLLSLAVLAGLSLAAPLPLPVPAFPADPGNHGPAGRPKRDLGKAKASRQARKRNR
jgi:hypothetical protein